MCKSFEEISKGCDHLCLKCTPARCYKVNREDIYEHIAFGYDRNTYSEHMRSNFQWPCWEWELCESLCQKVSEKHGRILDLGCGNGKPYGINCALTDDVEYTGVDISKMQVTRAREALPMANIVHGNIVDVTVEKYGQFDGIFCIDTLNHVLDCDIKTVLNNMHELLKQDGMAVISIQDTAPSHLVYNADWMSAPMFWCHHGVRNIILMAEDAGFNVEVVDATKHSEYVYMCLSHK